MKLVFLIRAAEMEKIWHAVKRARMPVNVHCGLQGIHNRLFSFKTRMQLNKLC